MTELDDGAADENSPAPDLEEDLIQDQAASSSTRISYKEMIDAAFDSYELDLDEYRNRHVK